MSRAIGLWHRFPEYFRQLRLNGMRYDYSWNQPGQDYVNIYQHIKA
jgi:starch synthase